MHELQSLVSVHTWYINWHQTACCYHHHDNLLPQYFNDGTVAPNTSSLLLEYVNSGKGLVMAMDGTALVNLAPYNITPMNAPTTTSCAATMYIGPYFVHPINDVLGSFRCAEFCADFSSVTDQVTTTLGTCNNVPAAVAKTFNINGTEVRRVDLNFFPFPDCDGINGPGWDSTTDGYKFMARSMLWVANALTLAP